MLTKIIEPAHVLSSRTCANAYSEVVVYEGADGSLSGSARSGFVGDADQAVERALEAVRTLKKKQ